MRGCFHDTDDPIEKALDALDEKDVKPAAASAAAKNLVELFEPIRGLLSNEEIDAMFSRNPSIGPDARPYMSGGPQTRGVVNEPEQRSSIRQRADREEEQRFLRKGRSGRYTSNLLR